MPCGRPELLVVMAATGWVTYAVMRWSNKYYMLFEMWGMVMVMGWTVVAVGVLGMEALRG